MNDKILLNAMSYIKDRFRDDHSGHDYYHSLRVFRLATAICKEEAANLKTVQLAALLHDVDDYKLPGGSTAGCPKAKAFLAENGISEEQTKFICDIIGSVSFKGTDTKIPKSIEGKIVQDADRLDAIGAIGIARAFAYGGNRNRDIYDPDRLPKSQMNFEEYAKSDGTTINHFYEKLLRLKNMMNTKTAKAIAEQRHCFMEGFLAEFFAEWNGER